MQRTVEFRKLEQALDHASWARNFGGAVVAGAAAVLLTLLLAGTRVGLNEFCALEALYGVLLSGSVAWFFRAVHALGRRPPRFVAVATVVAAVLLVLTGTVRTLMTTATWPILTNTRAWWWFVSEALPAAWVGGFIRDQAARIQLECRVGIEQELRRQRVRERRRPPPLPPRVS